MRNVFVSEIILNEPGVVSGELEEFWEHRRKPGTAGISSQKGTTPRSDVADVRTRVEIHFGPNTGFQCDQSDFREMDASRRLLLTDCWYTADGGFGRQGKRSPIKSRIGSACHRSRRRASETLSHDVHSGCCAAGVETVMCLWERSTTEIIFEHAFSLGCGKPKGISGL